MELVTCHVSPAQLDLQLRSLAPWGDRFSKVRILVPGEDDVDWAWRTAVDAGWNGVNVETCWYGEGLDLPSALVEYCTCDEPLGFKVLVPILVREPHLWMDGDVILTGDPARHLAGHYPWASRSGLDDWTKVGTKKVGTARPSQLAIEVFEAFGLTVDSRRRTDAAVWSMPRPVDRMGYLNVLQRFFTLPQVVADAAAGGNRRRTLDQKFLSVWLDLRGAAFTGGHPEGHPLHRCYRAAASWKQEEGRKSLGQATFLHYCCSGRKGEAIEKYSQMLAEATLCGCGHGDVRTCPCERVLA